MGPGDADKFQDAVFLKKSLQSILTNINIYKSTNIWSIIALKEGLDFESEEFVELINTLTELSFIANCKFDGWGSGGFIKK